MKLWRRSTIVAIGFVESLLFSGCLFGWPSLLHVLQQEGVYSHLCQRSNDTPVKPVTTTEDPITITSTLPSFFKTNTIFDDEIFDDVSDQGENLTNSDNNFMTDAEFMLTLTTTANWNHGFKNAVSGKLETPRHQDCEAQVAHMTLIYTCASICYGLTSIFIGFSLDIFGLWFTRLIGCVLTSCGFFCLVYTSKENSWLLWPALNLMALGTIQLRLSSFQFAKLWPQYRTTILIAYSSAYSVSTVLFLLIQIAYTNAIPYKSIVFILAGISLLTFPNTLVMPKFRVEDHIDDKKEVESNNTASEILSDSSKEKSIDEEDNRPRILREPNETKTLMNPFDENVDRTAPVVKKQSEPEVPLGESLFTLSAVLHLFWHFINFLLVLFYSATFYPWMKKMTDDKNLINHYNSISGLCALIAPIFIPIAGMITDWQIRNASKLEDKVEKLALTMQAPALTKGIASLFILGTMICKLFFTPAAVYASLVLIGISRPFIVGSCASYIQIRFYPNHFNRLNGIFTTIVSLLCMVQYPLLMWMSKSTTDFVMAQILLIVLLIVSLITSPGHMLIKPLARKYARAQLKFRTDI